MDEKDVRRPVLDWLSEGADRPFGNIELVTGRTLQPFSFAGQRAAENLLTKARRALDDGDVDRARAFVVRAVQLPFDEHEGAAPAALAVHLDLFCVITDSLEQADADDSRWLDAVVQVLGAADGPAAFDLRDVLVAIDQDFSLSRHERARIRAAISAIPDRAELRDLELTDSELCEHVLSILDARRAYGTALEALGQ